MKKKVSEQIRIGAIISYGSVAINLILTLVYTPWMIQELGQENYGLYTLASSIIGVTTIDFGLSGATARYLAKYRAERRPELGNEFLGSVIKVYGMLDMILALIYIIVYFCLDYIYIGLSREELTVLRVLFLIFAGYNLISYLAFPVNGILQSYEKFIAINLCNFVQRILAVLLVVVCLLNEMGVEAVAISNVIAGTIAIAVKLYIVKSQIPIMPKFRRFRIEGLGEIIGFSVWSTFGNLAVSLPYQLAASVFAITLNSISVAIFSPVGALGAYFNMIAGVINGMFLAAVSRYVVDDKNDQILKLMIKVGRYQTFILGLAYVGFICVGDSFILLWLGEKFYISYYCGIFYLFPLVLRYSQQIGNTTIIARNYVKEQGSIGIIICAVGSLLMLIMSKIFGIIGGCMALGITDMAYTFGMNYIHSRKLGLSISKFYYECYGSMILPMVIVITVGRFFLKQVGDVSVLWFLLKGIFVIMLYFFLMWILSLNTSEKDFIVNLFGKVLRRGKDRDGYA